MRKVISILFLITVILFSFGCANEAVLPYNATIFDKAENFMKEDYLADNNTHYPGATDGLPESICKTVESDGEFKNAFASFPEEIDFTKDILVVYFFTDIYYGFGCKLQTVTNDNGEIVINIIHQMAKKEINGARPPSTSAPTQRCLAVKLTDCVYSDIVVKLSYE